ncbi:MAG: hypothetical protein ABFS16_14240 [Bacteroidota bacterium]
MKKIILVPFMVFFCFFSFSQNLDLIVTDKGDSIACKIDSITDSNIYFQVIYDKKWIQTMQKPEEIVKYEYGVIDEYLYVFDYGTSVIRRKRNLASYNYLKLKYNHKDYIRLESDKYDPSLAGVMSLIPGLGHIYVGQPLRGLAYFGGIGASLFSMAYGFALAWGGDEFLSYILFFGGAAGVVTFYIADIVDAVRVAKVKNMALRDKAISFNISPTFHFKNQHNLINTAGLKLILTF